LARKFNKCGTNNRITVCVAIKVYDCIVFAADSAVTLTRSSPNGGSTASNVWKHGLKVCNLHRHLPITAMTAGLGNFGSMSINSLAKELRARLTNELKKENYAIKDAVNLAKSCFEQEFAAINPLAANPSSFEFWIGGCGSGVKHGEIWKVEIVDGQSLEPAQIASPSTSDQALWGGQIQALNRLLLG